MISKKNGIEYELIIGSSDSKINLVFIHGSGCDKGFLHALADQTKEYNSYLIDLPGHGGSDNTGYNIENYVDSINNFVQNLDNVILIGHSLGGTLVLSVSARNVSTVKGSIIISSAAKWSNLNKDFIQKIHKGIVDMDYLLECCGEITDPLATESLSHMSSELLLEDFIIDEIINVESCLKDINVPTTIVTGGDEILALVEYSEYMHRNIKNSKLTIIPNERHLLPITKNEEVFKLIKDLVISIDN